jgi:hypothetical protein
VKQNLYNDEKKKEELKLRQYHQDEECNHKYLAAKLKVSTHDHEALTTDEMKVLLQHHQYKDDSSI